MFERIFRRYKYSEPDHSYRVDLAKIILESLARLDAGEDPSKVSFDVGEEVQGRLRAASLHWRKIKHTELGKCYSEFSGLLDRVDEGRFNPAARGGPPLPEIRAKLESWAKAVIAEDQLKSDV